PDKGLPEPDTGTAAFLAMSHDMQLPLVTNQQASFHHLPPVDWNACLLQGYQAVMLHVYSNAVASCPMLWHFSSRLQHRRQSHDPYIKRASIKEHFHELSQRSEDLKQQDAHLKKDLQYLVEECQHNGRLADKRASQVVHAWRKHIRGLRRKSSGREQYDEYSQKLKDGPPPGWEP
ncbi:hypothetical protein BD769DRAFT_1530729, partial [Suillus cothurnatus]